MLKKLGSFTLGLIYVCVALNLATQHKVSAKTIDDERVQVVTTNSILADMVKQVGGQHVHVYSIVERGIDPHEYEPKPRDVQAAHNAEIVFHNGLNLETGGNGWFKKLMDNAHKKDGREVFAASKRVEPMFLTGAGKENEPDPHAWLAPENGIKYVEYIRDVLIEKDGKHRNYYMQRAAKYTAKLARVDQQAQLKFAKLVEDKRVLVTSEGAFKYFAAAYQLNPAFIWEINTEEQGTPQQMTAILKQIKQSKVKVLFVETSVSPKTMQKVARESKCPIYARIYTDSLGKKGQPGDTYLGMLRWNINKIANGLAEQ